MITPLFAPTKTKMSRIKQEYANPGFYGIGILTNTSEDNIGTLWRSAFILGASFIFTIDKKYKPQSSDITQSWTKIPLYHYPDFDSFYQQLPYATKLVGVELDDRAHAIAQYSHPERAVYLLGNEQIGLPENVRNQCHDLIQLPGNFSLNVAVAGSLVCFDRVNKRLSPCPH